MSLGLLGGVGRRLSKARSNPMVRVFVVAVLVGLLALAAVFLAGYLPRVPAPTVPVVGVTVPSAVLVVLVATALALVVGLTYVFFQKNREQWRQLPDPVRALVVGLVVSVLTVVGLAVSDYWYDVDPPGYVGGFLLALSLVTFVALRYYQRKGEVRDRPGATATAATRTGFAQMERLATRTVSAILGFVAAVLVGAATQYVATPLWVAVLLAMLVWLLTTIVLYNRFETWAAPRAREDLSIVGVHARSGDDRRELTVRNTGTEPADFAKAKVRDTSGDLYWLTLEGELAPGETRTFSVPEGFTLEPSENGVDLPLGYTLKQGAETAVVYSRAGVEMPLQRPDDG